MAIFRRFKVQQKYVNGQPTEEYRLGVEVDGINYHSLEACERGSECTELEYRWVDMESADDYICDGTNKYKKQKKQQKCVNEETWTDVYPYEYQKGDLIEQNSVDCGYEPSVEYHIYGATDGHGSINISPSKEYYSSTDVVTITALPSTDYMFSCYNYGGNMTYGSVAYNSVLSLTMSHNWYVSAVFKSAQYKVYDLTTFGGSLTISPSKEYYNPTDIVTITAIPNTNYSFSNYSYGSTSEYGQNSTNSTLTLTMSNDWYVRGNFLYESASGGNLYYSYTTGVESWYNWSKSTLASWHNDGSIARIIIDYGGVVQTISVAAFDSLSYLSKIVLPNCSSIGEGAFERCTSLSTISFPNCLFIGSEAFNACISLPSINFPNCTYVDNAGFANCISLTTINLPNCISVSNYAFSYCTSLTTVNLPKATYVGNGAFSHCKVLPSIYLPNCSSIGKYALAYCYSLTSVSLPNCSYVGNKAFTDCDSLISIDLPLCEYVGSAAFFTCTILTSVNLPLCSYVGGNAFNACSALPSIDLPNCSYVGNGAFEDCLNLSSISLPLCEYVGDQAFYNCQKISSINLPNCSYVGGAFSRCSILKTIRLPKVTYFNYHVFDYRTPIETLYMDQITSVPSGYDPFIDASYLKSIVIPCSLVDDFTKHSIWGKYSRYYVCTGGSEESDLKEIFTATDGGGVITLDPEGGKYYSGTTVNIGYSANPGYVFSYFQYGSTPAYGSTVLNESFSLVMNQNWYVSVNFDYGTASAESLYYSYSNGTESCYDWSKSTLSKYDNNGINASIIIDYGGDVQTIPTNAFSSHSYLTKIVFPNCTYINESAFRSCIVLTSIDLPLCSSVDYSAFADCTALTSVNLPSCITIGTCAFQHCTVLPFIDLPNCTSVEDYGFGGCSALESVNLPICSYIGSSVFSRCSALTSINLPNCSYVGDAAFANCTSLTSFSLPNCTSIGYGAFKSCIVLTSVNLPNCSYVDGAAFIHCSNLTSVSLPNCSYVAKDAFCDCFSLTSIYLPKCSYVGSWAFESCYLLISVNLPLCISVGSRAFFRCSLLTSVNLPNCSFIDSQTFFYCYSLTSINLPNCSYIGSSIFESCSALSIVSLPKITYIGSSAFSNAHIEALYMDQITSVPSGGDPYISISYIKSIFIPCSLLDSFVSHSIWSKYSSYFVCV